MDLNAEVIRMMEERPDMQVWLTLLEPGEAHDFDDVACAAGLEPFGRAWVEVDAARARRLLVGLLHKDLACKSAGCTRASC